jgi:hypothetical protein
VVLRFHNIESTALCFVLRGNHVHHVNLQCSHHCILVSSEVSHLIATLVKRYVVHTENTDLHIPVTRLAVNSKGAIGPLRHMCHIPYCSQPETNSTDLI